MPTLAALALVALASAELQPKTYASPSGRWSLRVEPEERSGTKGAEYVLTGGEREAWRKKQSFALWDAVVTDDGRVAGYAYSGAELDAPAGGSLRVVLLSPTGDVLLDEAHERAYSHFEHGSGDPHAVGLFAQPERGRFVVRVADEDWNRGAEAWWAYELATGKALAQERPKQKLAVESHVNALLAARPIAGTPLVLLHWWRTDFERKPWQLGGVFQLVDADWKTVWSLTLPADYALANEDAQEALRTELWTNGAVLSTGPRLFELRFVAENARVSFGVERAGDAWKVSELSRTPYAAPAAAAALATRTLTLSRRVPLGAAPAPGVEIRDIEAFGFDERSRLRFVRREGDAGAVSLVTLDESGGVRRATRVAPPAGVERETWFPLPGERWFAVADSYGEATARLRLVQEGDGRAREIPGFSGQEVERIEALGAEAFVLLGSWNSRYTRASGLIAFDLGGTVLWSVGENLEDEQALFSPEDMAVTTDQRVVVLDNIRQQLQVYSARGEYQQTVALAPVWGHEPNYPSGIHADRDGGVLVNDFEGEPPLYRMTSAFVLTASFDAHRGDGSALDEYRRFAQVAPDGRLWTTDRHEFLRLDESGRVDLELGSPERADELVDPGFACVDSLFGRVLVHDQRSRAVHVFDGEGRRVTLCTPTPEEREALDYPMALAVAADGSVYVAESQYAPRALHFRPDGSSAGFEDMKAANVSFAASGGDYLGVRGARVERLNAEHKALGSLDKRPDGQWFRSIEDLALAADGSLAVLELPASEGGLRRGAGDGCVVLFDPQGKALKSFPFPAEVPAQEIAFVGQRVLLKDWERAWRMDARDGSLVALTLAEPACAFGLSPDGSELWAVAKDGRSLLRYTLDP